MKIINKITFFFILFAIFLSASCNISVSLMSLAYRTIDLPQVIKSSILPYQINVDLSSDITLTFKNSMDTDSIEQNFSFQQNGIINISYKTVWFNNNQILRIIPNHYLVRNAVYLIRIQNNAFNDNGFKFLKNYELFFTTANKDIFPPVVLRTYPDSSVNRFTAGQNIMIIFNEPMNPEITNNAFSLINMDDKIVDGEISWDGNNFIFNPKNDLIPFAAYTIKLRDNACDLEGNKLQQDLIFTFKVYGEIQYLQKIGKQNNSSKYYINLPKHIAYYKKDNNQYFFITDFDNNRVIKYRYLPLNNGTGEFVFLESWGNKGFEPKEFFGPYGIAVSADGYVYVTEKNNSRVQVFDIDGNYITQWGHLGKRDGELSGPKGVAVGLDGFVYVADTFNNRIQKFNPKGSGGYQITILKPATSYFSACPYTDQYPLSTPYYIKADMSIALVERNTSGAIGLVFNYIDENNFCKISINTRQSYQINQMINGIYTTPAIVDWTPSFDINKPGLTNRIELYQYSDYLDIYINSKKINSISSIKLPTSRIKVMILTDLLNSTTITGDFSNLSIYKLIHNSLESINKELLYADDFTSLKNWTQVFTSEYITNYKTFVKKWGQSDTAARNTPDGELKLPSGITVDANGYIYVVDSSNDFIHKFDTEGNLINKWGNPDPNETGIIGGEYSFPEGIAIDPAGYIYISDTPHHRIQQFDLNGNLISQWGKNGGTCEIEPYNGTADGEFNTPIGIATDSEGFIYIVDSLNNRIQKIDNNGNFKMKYGYNNNLSFYGSGDGEYNQPSGVAVAPDGSIFIADTNNNRIQKFDQNGIFIYKWSGNNEDTLSFPKDIAVGKNNLVYIADTGNHCIRKLDITNNLNTKWGKVDRKTGINDGEFNNPAGIAVGPDGAVYVADSSNHRIQKFDQNGVFITKWGKNSGNVTLNSNGIPDNYGNGYGEFNNPTAIAVNSEGFVYVADTNNNRIQKFDQNGVYIKEFGISGIKIEEFNFPSSIAIDSANCIYVADKYNHRIQMFTANENFIMTWGILGKENYQFRELDHVAVSPNGKIFTTDLWNSCIKTFRIISY